MKWLTLRRRKKQSIQNETEKDITFEGVLVMVQIGYDLGMGFGWHS